MSDTFPTFPLSGEEDIADPLQVPLFDRDEHTAWWNEWQGMPEFDQRDLTPMKSVLVHFSSSANMAAFAALVEQRITPKTRSIWYPEAEIGHFADKRYADES